MSEHRYWSPAEAASAAAGSGWFSQQRTQPAPFDTPFTLSDERSALGHSSLSLSRAHEVLPSSLSACMACAPLTFPLLCVQPHTPFDMFGGERRRALTSSLSQQQLEQEEHRSPSHGLSALFSPTSRRQQRTVSV